MKDISRIFEQAEEKALRDYYRMLNQEWLADQLREEMGLEGEEETDEE